MPATGGTVSVPLLAECLRLTRGGGEPCRPLSAVGRNSVAEDEVLRLGGGTYDVCGVWAPPLAVRGATKLPRFRPGEEDE
mmetsp:Transcript_69954/g.156671  ORF Transcript_69954/g.156671 Transcript_69954/m.156671 type:complete len:80 (-) Transcript_69954:121-360(-)